MDERQTFDLSPGGSRVDPGPASAPATAAGAVAGRVAVVDLLDRILAGGVVAMGDIELSIADVPLVRISLRAVVASVSALAAETASGQSESDGESADVQTTHGADAWWSS